MSGPTAAGGPPRRLRVTVVGNSTVYTVAPRRFSRADAPYPELLGQALARSFDVDVQCHAQWFGMVDQAADGYELLIRSAHPDVVIIGYGINECMPRILPNRLTDHLLDWNRRRGRARDWYRSRVIPRVWPGFRWIQRKGAHRLGLFTWRMTPRRFESEMRRLVGAVTEDLRALVLVVGIAPPSGDIVWLLPHLDRRRDVYERILERVVESFDDDVRLLDPARVIPGFGPDALPDGIHLSADAHRVMAEALATEIESWACAAARGPWSGQPAPDP